MQLRYISVAALIAEAGGDPWAINQSLQAGSPFQIAQLAEAFLKAGRCTAEATNAFDQARSRFDAAWNHQNGDHPINGSAEVQRVTKSLGAQSLQLPKIAADLENIAANLAEAQKAAAGQIAALEGQLQQLDGFIGQVVELEKDPTLTAEDRHALDAFISGREDDAIRDTKAALGQLQSTRDGYANSFQNAMGTLHADGYDLTPAPAGPGPAPADQPGGGPALAPTKGEVLTGTAGAIAGGTADGVRGATTKLIAESPGTGPGKADPGLLRWFEDPKIGGFELKGFSRVGRVVGAASAVPAVMSDIHDGNSVPEAVTREGVGTAFGLYAGAAAGGFAADMAAGAAIGSVVPGAGTAIGLVVGAVVGAGAAFGASKAVEVAWQPVANAVGSAVHGVESIFGFG
ncbi:hypothetical protein [Mycobacterium intracellulare]|uniref:putative alpha/beta hydrolase n=1 Tax=Mycobacterium intracellulare TaxID=1767 RepID=UPI0002ABC1FD|nr:MULTISPECIES: hypothetical protein [Mycobacterium]ASX02546.1 hypothetical protein CKJ58_23210 [Mycobacterium intracellulare subsp. chimaera]ELR83252.1 hypothetical protein W7U_19605 [Mycobacterium sp. H4Y]PBA57632.1 hypothetical protein CKJ57_24925 [Mycobacterium intracellulare subsp. chimaera]PBA59682.1 hypothetical protein CKJ56_23405 [Mycobacterium intracellulare subsp. chimaera]UEB25388.1 hypothetical protein LK403_03905 [Mycobacterium intracellulare]